MIELRGITKRFGAVTAVDDLSCTVRPGLVTGFLGPNGAGKTTTMRIILGLAAPTAGTALVGGRRYRKTLRPLRQVGSLLDATALYGGRTAYDHLLSLAVSNGIGRARVCLTGGSLLCRWVRIGAGGRCCTGCMSPRRRRGATTTSCRRGGRRSCRSWSR